MKVPTTATTPAPSVAVPEAGGEAGVPSADGLEVPVLEVPLARVPSAVTGMPNGLTPLRPLVTGDESRGWEGGGRLNIGRNAFCSAAMIAPNRILTAAHCLFDKKTGGASRSTRCNSLPIGGWAGRWPIAPSAVQSWPRAIATAPPIRSTGWGMIWPCWSLPVRSSPPVTPFAVGHSVRAGAAVGVVSYARHRADAPSLQRLCHVLTRLHGALMFDCSVDFGASGAPVFTIHDGVASIVSAKAQEACGSSRPPRRHKVRHQA